MRDKEKEEEIFNNRSTVYGPVKSWRLGMSLGIDPIFETSTCSFNCFYCQLGQIQEITDQIREYVPTQRVLDDFKKILDESDRIDVATYSGSGEPTLAANIHEMIAGIKKLAPHMPQMILTNATELYLPEVRERLKGLDKIIVKIDAANEETFKKVNRPAAGVTLARVLKGIKELQKEYSGPIEVQSMFMPLNIKEASEYAALLKEIRPEVVQLNTPKRPYPSEWHRENRGNHEKLFDYRTTDLKTLTPEQAADFESFLRKETGLEILSIYK
ncbi:MAG: radical SAM protein [Halobacteriovoraceae bacterium]|nr:radical SAM protein [Halobacteriovoraceae bacterium]